MIVLVWLLLCLQTVYGSTCVCTTVPCPVVGQNNAIMGGGGANITYTYATHGDFIVVVSAEGTITPESLDHGTETTSCTQKYSRMLEDNGEQDCDAGHILANRLGGYGNTPVNIFPQDASTNRGSYAQFEGDIYNCMKSGAKLGSLQWKFTYDNVEKTMPSGVVYSAQFEEGTCKSISSQFPN
jgi:hypothetical protein